MTTSVNARGSQGASVGSLPAGISGEKRASAVAVAPGASTTLAAACPGMAGETFVGSFAPCSSSSSIAGMPETVHDSDDEFTSLRR